MRELARRTLLLALIPLTLLFGGCPHHIESMVEETLPPADYKPIYMTSTMPFGQVIEAWKGKITVGTGGISTGTVLGSEADSATLLPLQMDIRTVDDHRYPNEIELRAFVFDTNGRFVMGLAPPYFAGQGNYRNYWKKLVDSCNGTTTTIDSFNVTEVRQDRREPYAIALVLDHSPSMGESRARKLQEAITLLLKVIKKGDMVAVVKFTSTMKVEVPLTADSSLYKRLFQIDGLRGYEGGTAMYDGTLRGIDELKKAPAGYKRVAILFSDGGDNSSDSTLESVHRVARETNTAIYTVAYGMAEEEPMRNLAGYTGGRFYRLYSTKEFPYVFADIYRSMNNYYRITYRPPQCDARHTARAWLSFPELQALTVSDYGTYDRSLFTPFDPVGTIAFVNIEFDYDKATIRPESLPLLGQVAEAMRSNPKLVMEIRGHTDDRGGDDYNQRLSEKRAEAVLEELVEMGIGRNRLVAKGFGESKPLVENDTDEHRRSNRRTEFVIIRR
ncbi:MAG: VWA domain-containing protein [Chlorobi bacterium CHB2]|nr:VWA domain-containing protein [Chlorobi bacterium CHB2]